MSLPSLASALRPGASPSRLADAKHAALTIARAADEAQRTGVFTQSAVIELRDLHRRALLLALWCGEARARCREVDLVFDVPATPEEPPR